MDWKDALSVLRKLEGTSEQVGIVESEINRLTNANFELVRDTRNASSRAKDAETKLTELLGLVGAEGDDLKAKVESANGKVKALTKQLDEVGKDKTRLETEFTNLQNENQSLKRLTLVQTAATKSGAVPDVLATLTRDLPLEAIVVEKDKVAIAVNNSHTDLKEYAEAEWKAFLPALFPNASPALTESTKSAPQSPLQQTKLPTGGTSSGTPPQGESLLAQYSKNTYGKTIDKMLANKV